MRVTHAEYVLDASVAAKWFTRHDEADREKAAALRSLHQSGRCSLVVPEFALLEVLNAIRFSPRADEEDAARAVELLQKLRLEIAPLDWELLRKATSTAWSCQVAIAAAYVALAERRGCPLMTADEVMVKKMTGHGVGLRLRDLDFT